MAAGLPFALFALLLLSGHRLFRPRFSVSVHQLLVQSQFVAARERCPAVLAPVGGRAFTVAPPLVQNQRSLGVIVAVVGRHVLVLADSTAQPPRDQADHVLVADVTNGALRRRRLIDLARGLLLATLLLLDEDHVFVVVGLFGRRRRGVERADRHFRVIAQKLGQREALLGHDDAVLPAGILLDAEHRLAERRR